jgi:hypothetical protein
MDALWYRRYRQDGGEADFGEWETTDADEFDEAGAPAEVAQRAAQAVGTQIPEEQAGTANDVVHWLTGVGNGVGHALLQGERNPLVGGAMTGATAFASSYGVLGAIGVYEPIWEYDATTLRKDFGAHLVYGVATGLAYAALGTVGSNGAAD